MSMLLDRFGCACPAWFAPRRGSFATTIRRKVMPWKQALRPCWPRSCAGCSEHARLRERASAARPTCTRKRPKLSKRGALNSAAVARSMASRQAAASCPPVSTRATASAPPS